MRTVIGLVALVAALGVGAAPAGAQVGYGGYVVDAYGGLHPFGGATAVTGGAYWPGQDLARGVAVTPTRGGWVLDAYGGVHPFAGGPAPTGAPYWSGQDLARAIVAAPTRGGWVLDAYGGVHAFGGAPAITTAAFWPGRDLARALVPRPAGGGWVVDAYGGVHAYGGAPAVTSAYYLPGFDVVRGAVANRRGRGGWVLDLFGGLHAFGGAPVVTSPAAWPGQDLARGVIPDTATYGGWVLDAYGGLHAFGGARTVGSPAYWPGVDLARGAGTGTGSSGGRTPPRVRRTPVLRRVTYDVAVRGSVHSDLGEFINAVENTYADERGWSAAGFEFVRVPSGGTFTVWLSQAALVPTFGAPCDSFYSCDQGRNVIINDDRFASGSPYWPGPLADYRHMVIDHETGHWIGFGHLLCGGPGALAPVMMQQSKGLQGCAINPWPLPSEIAAARARLGGSTVGPQAGSATATSE